MTHAAMNTPMKPAMQNSTTTASGLLTGVRRPLLTAYVAAPVPCRAENGHARDVRLGGLAPLGVPLPPQVKPAGLRAPVAAQVADTHGDHSSISSARDVSSMLNMASPSPPVTQNRSWPKRSLGCFFQHASSLAATSSFCSSVIARWLLGWALLTAASVPVLTLAAPTSG